MDNSRKGSFLKEAGCVEMGRFSMGTGTTKLSNGMDWAIFIKLHLTLYSQVFMITRIKKKAKSTF